MVSLPWPSPFSDGVALLRNCAIVQALPVLALVLLSDIELGELNLELIAEGTNYLFFGSVAIWAMLVGTRAEPRTIDGLARG